MLENIKNALRISGNYHDKEVSDLIESAKADLLLSGVLKSKLNEHDPLIKRAITSYCKANFGYDDTNLSDRFQDSYNSLKTHLTLSVEYTKDEEI